MSGLLTLPERPRRPARGERLAVMLVARAFLLEIMREGMPLPADMLDVWWTRDHREVVLLLAGVGLPSDQVLAVFRRDEDRIVRFIRWEPEPYL